MCSREWEVVAFVVAVVGVSILLHSMPEGVLTQARSVDANANALRTKEEVSHRVVWVVVAVILVTLAMSLLLVLPWEA